MAGTDGYTMWTSDGAPLGGVTKLSLRRERPPHWLGVHLHAGRRCDGEAGRRSRRAHARAADRHSRPSAASRCSPIRMARCSRRSRPKQRRPGHEGEAQLREFSWHELATHDYPAAFRFYERLFGWEKTHAMDMGEAGVYQMFGRNGVDARRHVQRIAADARAAGWLHYVLVDDVESRRRRGQGRWRAGAQRADGSARRRLDRAVRGPAGRDVRGARAGRNRTRSAHLRAVERSRLSARGLRGATSSSD